MMESFAGKCALNFDEELTSKFSEKNVKMEEAAAQPPTNLLYVGKGPPRLLLGL